MSLILIYALIGAVSMAVVFFMLTKSPEGFEDEQGFHYGTPDNKLYAVNKAEKTAPAKARNLSGVYSA